MAVALYRLMMLNYSFENFIETWYGFIIYLIDFMVYWHAATRLKVKSSFTINTEILE
jgi:hypothetical protein